MMNLMKRTLLGGLALLAATTFAQAEDHEITGKVRGVEPAYSLYHDEHTGQWWFFSSYTVDLEKKDKSPACGIALRWGYTGGDKKVDFTPQSSVFEPVRTVQKDVLAIERAQASGTEMTIFGTSFTPEGCLVIDTYTIGKRYAEDPKQITPPVQPAKK